MTWSYENGSSALFTWIAITLAIGFGGFFAMLKAPARARKYIVGVFTFAAGLVYVLNWLWPAPQDRVAGQLPYNSVEAVSFFVEDAVGRFRGLSNTLTAFLLLLGVFSLVRLHLTRVAKKQKDWGFSMVLLVTVALMALFGYWDWRIREGWSPQDVELMKEFANRPMPVNMKDFLFEGLLQTMEAGMFSIIAFYILSAAYRAFRIRSVEATILLASALITMLGLLGLAENYWSLAIDAMGGTNPDALVNNFRLDSISGFIRNNLQAPGLRAIDFGVGVGALAMALRLWLGLERGGTAS